jgi:hypothetical protein
LIYHEDSQKDPNNGQIFQNHHAIFGQISFQTSPKLQPNNIQASFICNSNKKNMRTESERQQDIMQTSFKHHAEIIQTSSIHHLDNKNVSKNIKKTANLCSDIVNIEILLRQQKVTTTAK